MKSGCLLDFEEAHNILCEVSARKGSRNRPPEPPSFRGEESRGQKMKRPHPGHTADPKGSRFGGQVLSLCRDLLSLHTSLHYGPAGAT